jgi:hypothetical protein
MNTNEGVWLSINDYSRYKSISASTIRRHIKNNILKYKEENGKYFIFIHSVDKLRLKEHDELLLKNFELETLKLQFRNLQEENSELKMLVSIYETKRKETLIEDQDFPPEIPEFI